MLFSVSFWDVKNRWLVMQNRLKETASARWNCPIFPMSHPLPAIFLFPIVCHSISVWPQSSRTLRRRKIRRKQPIMCEIMLKSDWFRTLSAAFFLIKDVCFVVCLFCCLVVLLIGYYAGGHYKQPDHKTTKQPDNQTTTYRFIIFLPFTI